MEVAKIVAQISHLAHQTLNRVAQTWTPDTFGHGQHAAAYFPPVEKADTVPELEGWGLVSDASGTVVGGRLVMMVLSLGAGAKAMPGLFCRRVHFGSYLHAVLCQ